MSVALAAAETLILESSIERVVVYARGARVTRRVHLPASIQRGAAELRVVDLTPSLEPGSVQVEATGARSVLGVRVAAPEAPPLLPAGARRLARERLEVEARRLGRERARIGAELELLRAFHPRLELERRRFRSAPAQRMADVLGVEAYAGELELELRRAELAVLESLAANGRALAAAAAEEAQAKEAERRAQNPPRLEAQVQLAAGEGALTSLHLSYVVPEARWWPVYTARIREQGQQADLSLEALVAQQSGEDWSGVELALCTAMLQRSVVLPELPALRLGRAAPPRRAYRPPPEGLEHLFAPYREARARWAPPPPPVALPEPEPRPRPQQRADLMKAQAPAAKPRPRPSAPAGSPPLEKERAGARPVIERARAAPAELDPPPLAGPAKGGFFTGSAGGAPRPEVGAVVMGMDTLSEQDEAGALPFALEDPRPLEPQDRWLDFEHLLLDDGDGAHPGQLRAPTALSSSWSLPQSRRVDAIEALSPRTGARDPAAGEESFDHRWDCAARADVPATGQPHKLVVARASAPVRPRLVTVPLVEPSVFRELELTNPFSGPLLSGPVDVFVDGALLTSGELRAVDVGGPIFLGLGAEERVKVARNVRVKESSAGVLGGSVEVEHQVTIELASALGYRVPVIVRERVPVTVDNAVEVELLEARPRAEDFDQAERGAPIRGGKVWRVELEPGAKRVLELRYLVTMSSKLELVGGNRRG